MTKAQVIAWAERNGISYVYSHRCPATGQRVYSATNDKWPHRTLEWSAIMD